jgi:hypothetical protein
MKKLFTLFLMAACLHLPVAAHLRAGEIKKKPLNLDEMVVLAREQVKDYEETKNTEAGIANGYGLLTLALAIAAGYLISEQLSDDDDNKKSSSSSSNNSSSTSSTSSTATSTSTSSTSSSSSH